MPAVKKHASTRSRPHKASTAATLPAAGKRTAAPKLPASRAWLPETKSWWADLWKSPMADEYHSSDRHALLILAVLVDEFWANPSRDLAGEIRLQRMAFGLTPYDRRRLEWTIQPSAPKTRRSTALSSVQPKAGHDPRLALVQ